MTKSLFKTTLTAVGVAALMSGCNTINTPQNLTQSLPMTFNVQLNSIEGTDAENQVEIKLIDANMVKAPEGSKFPVELHFIGRFTHPNPRVKTDSPFEAKAGFFLKHHGDGIVSIESLEMIDLELLSVHTPVRSLIYRDSKKAFTHLLEEINGRYLPEQKMLKISSNMSALFGGDK